MPATATAEAEVVKIRASVPGIERYRAAHPDESELTVVYYDDELLEIVEAAGEELPDAMYERHLTLFFYDPVPGDLPEIEEVFAENAEVFTTTERCYDSLLSTLVQTLFP